MSAHTTTSEPDPQPPRTHKGPNSPASARCGSSGCQPQPCALTSLVRAVRLPIGLPSLLSASTLGFGHPHWSRALAIRTGAGLWPSALEPGFGHPHWSRPSSVPRTRVLCCTRALLAVTYCSALSRRCCHPHAHHPYARRARPQFSWGGAQLARPQELRPTQPAASPPLIGWRPLASLASPSSRA